MEANNVNSAAAVPPKPGMNLHEIMRDYIEAMLSEQPGRKALILDRQTLVIVSMIYSRTQILQKEVFFIDVIDNVPAEKLMHLKAIFFLRCTDENVQKVCQQLQNPTFSSYNLYFSNTVSNSRIQTFAENDIHNVVNQVQEVFADFQTINEDLFSLDVGSTLSLSQLSQNQWTYQDQQDADRVVDGLFGVIMATRCNPILRYDSNSSICKYIAEKVQAKIAQEQDFVNRMSRNSPSTHLLIVDRREDPVTPLLNQWTYQAMVHELIGIKDNRVDLKHLEHLSEEMKEVVLSASDDPFFKKVKDTNYGELNTEIQKLVQTFLHSKQSQAQFNSIEDMQRVIENFPEFKASQRNTTKHWNVAEELKKICEGRSLYSLSEVEQELASGSQGTNKQNMFNQVAELVENSSISKFEKLRLLLLFSLRFENDNLVFNLKQKMRTAGVGEDQLRLVDCMLEYGGKTKRSSELFGSQSIGAKAKRLFNMNEVENLLLAHKPHLCQTVTAAMQGKLMTQKFATLVPFDYRDRPSQMIVFMVGGATFQEARELSQTYNTDADTVIVGGTYMHNSRSFIAEVSQITTLRKDGNSGIQKASLEIQ